MGGTANRWLVASRGNSPCGGMGEERRGREGVTGLGSERGLKPCILELVGWGEKWAEEPEEGESGSS